MIDCFWRAYSEVLSTPVAVVVCSFADFLQVGVEGDVAASNLREYTSLGPAEIISSLPELSVGMAGVYFLHAFVSGRFRPVCAPTSFYFLRFGLLNRGLARWE